MHVHVHKAPRYSQHSSAFVSDLGASPLILVQLTTLLLHKPCVHCTYWESDDIKALYSISVPSGFCISYLLASFSEILFLLDSADSVRWSSQRWRMDMDRSTKYQSEKIRIRRRDIDCHSLTTRLSYSLQASMRLSKILSECNVTVKQINLASIYS